jgi:hypothetical protein
LRAGSEARATKLRRYGLAALAAFIALNVWTGCPLLALWIGSQVQGEASQPSMGAFLAVIGCLVLFSFLLYQALQRVVHAYREATGTTPTVRSHAPWLRSMRDERPEHAPGPGPGQRARADHRGLRGTGRADLRDLVLLPIGLVDRRRLGPLSASAAARRPILAQGPP